MTGTVGVPRKAALAAFDDADAAAFLSVASVKEVGAGQAAWDADEAKRGLVIILAGRVELSLPTEFPERRVVMGIFGPGSVVGETNVFGGNGGKLIALAVEPATLAELSAERLAAMAESHPATHGKLLHGLLKVLSIRIGKAYERMSSVF